MSLPTRIGAGWPATAGARRARGAAGDRAVLVSRRRRAREARVDVDDLRTARLGLHHPLEAHRVALGHVGALDDDAVAVLQVLQEVRGSATTERGPQTGDGGAVSYAGLVLDLDRAQGREQLLDEVVLLVVERRPAERGEPEGAVDPLALELGLPGALARVD